MFLRKTCQGVLQYGKGCLKLQTFKHSTAVPPRVQNSSAKRYIGKARLSSVTPSLSLLSRNIVTTSKCAQVDAAEKRNVTFEKITSFSAPYSHLKIKVAGQSLQLYYVWLRDHCQCKQCIDQKTFQKNIVTNDIPLDIQPKEVNIEGDDLVIEWPDGHVTTYSLNWLLENAYPGKPDILQVPKVLWNAETIKSQSPTPVPYQEYMDTDGGLRNMLKDLLTYGFGLVSEVPANTDATEKVARRVAFVKETLYGGMWYTRATGEYKDYKDSSFSNVGLGSHIDTCYFNEPSGIQVFHCLQEAPQGGESVLVDGFHVAMQVKKQNPDAFDYLVRTPIPHYCLDDQYHLRSVDTTFRLDPCTGDLVQFRYNNYDRGIINTIPADEIPRFYCAMKLLSQEVMSPDNEYWFKLSPGTVIFIDNWRTMHGRAEFAGERILCGCYLPRDDWLSKARYLGLAK
ncbi:trimethyllysine dioxygenase, mitochondrial isoform X1 [Lingula anatina]|uniref:Trimethyllysine dioxygenase, mitochondrial n=1 Tax=Lingula anatina TaxID=7574 RepID=A0A1S3JD69_LINAN|nr:trimethyllysine dioxygenase, mitochondrial isoform X1 [Lingula anatina]XP_013408351.1 trimethyllysine dioxygenase, mitochondrial isoform X1 [Lingula anatina]XP_013408352.1 trimethyllysine dioxygenase, mitochondrial isoform X1 [Lingula anatina]XP_013408355.1 trimethyllysine dioxygenase, mitochondrial isoform X1 [Lingula anatina]|eukprot:XP_013408349.1 trimethyllysine dioxygenase, mitochondrial isoform X1 [Lingula anatina]